ncbi:transposase [Bdellovibrio sp. SKB1291214]|uniref:transposase n=1 Tax=Bdellovibrio sp. SKB1291214 TaxID=1732569 RepID=UPI00223FC344|nr:transposase [Bdellovibrio sp. SKB1291214]UYL08715.1 transposase [Bdellovibrio sp. SKB1291214]
MLLREDEIMKQRIFSGLDTNWKFRYCHGGTLRKSSKGRGARPLSTKDPIHLVFKINKAAVTKGLRHPRNFNLMNALMKKYARKFFVKIEQASVQTDHIHILIRGGRRSAMQSFFRVVAGQFAQCLTDTFTKGHEGERIWKHRPFTRVIRGFKPYRIVRDYIQLNELEALGRPYSKTRLRGLSEEQLRELWV